MISAKAWVAVIPLVMGVLIGAGEIGGVKAEQVQSYQISANDGYGLSDCLSSVGECGQVVADAWCEAHGHGSAVSYGPQSRFEGATKISTASESYVVNCRD